MNYTSVNGTFTYTITNTSSYVFDSTDYAIIQSAFDRWDNIMTLDSRLGAGYTITISYSVEVLEAGILGGASIQTVAYFSSQTFGNTFPYAGDITLNAIYLSGMKNAVRSDGKTSYYYVLLHEIGHILGIGSFWNLPGTPKVSYLDNGVTKYYYTGANALREYKSYFTAMGSSSFVGVPIEDNGGAGTVNVHPEEGLEGGVSADNRYINGILHPGLDTELMTGWLDSAPVSTPLSRITLGFLADMGYSVNYNLADLYMMAWLATDNANNLEQTYITGFLDVSGTINHRSGDLNVMDGNLIVRMGDVSLNNGNLYVGGNVVLNSNLNVSGATTLGRVSVSQTMDVSGATTLVGALAISGLTSFNDNVSVSGNKTFTVGTGATAMGGDATLNSTLSVGGGVSMNSGLRVAGATTLTNAIMGGPVSVSGRVAFLNDVSFTGTSVDICGNLYAQYPANSIPAAAIIGGISVVSLFDTDVSLGATLSVGGATSLSTLAATNATLRSTVGIVGSSTMTSLTTSGATTFGGSLGVVGKAALTNDVSFNGSRIDICGNLYANYPANSIPSSAVVGGGVNPIFMTDVSVNAAISAAGVTTLKSTLVVSGKTTLANDISFNGSRIDICGNLYANYPANSIPSAAIIGGTAVSSTFNTDVSMNSRLYVKESIKIGNLGTLLSIPVWYQDGGTILPEGADNTSSVSISADGSIVAVGCILNDGTVGGTDNRGHVMVYQRNAANTTVAPFGWTKLGGDIDGEAASDNSGFSVSLSADGSTVAIGAIYNDGTVTASDCGHVRVYKYRAAKTVADTNQSSATFGPVGWDRLGADIDGEALGDNSGQSVSLSADGSTVAICAIYNDGTTANTSDSRGHVRVYKYRAAKTVADNNQSSSTFGPAGWDRLGADIDGETQNDQSGFSLSLSADGSTVAIGANQNDGTVASATDNRGHVRVYKYRAAKTVADTNQSSPTFGPVGWDRLGADIDGEAATDGSGISLSLSADGSIVAIGATLNDGTVASASDNRGQVRVYKYRADKLAAVTDQSLSTFGPAGWDRLGGDIDGEAATDQSGISLSLSADGSIVAIGANQNDGTTGSNRGHVRVYKYDVTKVAAITDQSLSTFGPVGWNRIGPDIDGTNSSDQSGQGVSLSANGSTIAVMGLTTTYAVKVYKVGDPQLTTSVLLSTSGLQTDGIAAVNGTLVVSGATSLSSTLSASGATTLSTLNVTGATTLSTMTTSSNATIGGALLVTGTSSMGVVTMNSTLSVGAATTMSARLIVNSDVSMNNRLSVGAATTMNSTLIAAGATTLNNNAVMASLVTAGAVTTNTTLYAVKSVTMNGNLDTSGVLFMSTVSVPTTLVAAGAVTMVSVLSVGGAATMKSTLNTTGAVTVGGILSVAGVTTMSGLSTMNTKLSVGSDVSMNSTLTVANNATLASTLAVVGATTLSSTLYTSGSTTINNTLNVTGKTTFLNDVSFNNNVSVTNTLKMNNNRITVGSSNIQYNGGVGVDTAVIPSGMHTTNNTTVGGVLAISGGTVLLSTLAVGGAATAATVYAGNGATIGSTLNVTGAATVGSLTISGATTVSTITTSGATTVGGTLGISGAATMTTLNIYGPVRQW